MSSTLGGMADQRLGEKDAKPIEEAARELESPMKSRKSNRTQSVMSHESKNSRADQMNDMLGYLDEVNLLIKDEEWYNIPAPIRKTCEGIIGFQGK